VAIRSRIARTRERLEKTAWQLEQFGSAKAAGYLRRWLPSIVTFAEHAVEGFEVPWTSNPVERLMGEVSKRCKNQWMRWTAEGLEAILQLRLVKYADPEYYQAFLDELLQRSTKTAINCDLSLRVPAAKSRPLCNTTKSLSDIDDPAQRYSFLDDFFEQIRRRPVRPRADRRFPHVERRGKRLVGDETCVHARPTVATHQTGGEDPRGNQRETRATRLPPDLELTMVVLAGQLTNKGRAVLLDQFRGRSPSNCRPSPCASHRPSSTRNWSARRCSHTTPTSRAPKRRAISIEHGRTGPARYRPSGRTASRASTPNRRVPVAGSEEVAR